jgi:hypothetical protein
MLLQVLSEDLLLFLLLEPRLILLDRLLELPERVWGLRNLLDRFGLISSLMMVRSLLHDGH